MKRIVTMFKEYKEFRKDKHWDANVMYFPTDSVVPPHYADTVEILVNHGATGTIRIGGQVCDLGAHCAYFIAPDTVHAVDYHKNEGSISILKIDHRPLKRFLDLEAVLDAEKIEFGALPCYLDEPAVAESLERVLFTSDSLFAVLESILAFFLHIRTACNAGGAYRTVRDNGKLRTLIEWSEQHFSSHISLDEAASILGYNKNYFCQKFKEQTGVTYLHYLNCLRVSRACTELKNGHSVSEVCYTCGFENLSYFIRLFRSVMGVTPAQYVRDCKSFVK